MPTIQEVKKKHEASLLEIKGVVSIGIGLGTNKHQTIIIGLEKEIPGIYQKIPKILEGYPVEIQIIGEIKAR